MGIGVKTLIELFLILGLSAATVDVHSIIQRSVEANNRDWDAAPEFSYTETDHSGAATKTYRVRMIEGSPYSELTAINGEPLNAKQKARQQQNLQAAIDHRRAESKSQHQTRVASYERGRHRDHVLIDQLTQAFDFQLVGTKPVNGRETYELRATPRAGYVPPNTEAKVLTGMQGTLWIDAETSQWVKVEAQVTRPVWIAGFIAKVMPGTRFELEYAPAADGVWLPIHFLEASSARVMFVFNRHDHDDENYSNYTREGNGAR